MRPARFASVAVYLCMLLPCALHPAAQGFLGLFSPAAAMGQIVVVDHQPHPFGGLASDTLFVGSGGQPVWQQVADNFILNDDYEIGTIRWWGFYNADNPPASETMRIRFYGARPGDALPDDGNLVYETSVQDHTRTWTGRIVATGIGPREYLYQAILPTPVWLDAKTKHWLEIAQIGDLSTYFRWEFSLAAQDGMAFKNAALPDWQDAMLAGDCAYQLITVPEPSTCCFLGLGLVHSASLRKKRGCRG